MPTARLRLNSLAKAKLKRNPPGPLGRGGFFIGSATANQSRLEGPYS